MAAPGKGLLRIAKALNAEGIPNPTGQDRRKTSKRCSEWSSTGIREVLRRDLYRGRSCMGKLDGRTSARPSARSACPSPSGSCGRPRSLRSCPLHSGRPPTIGWPGLTLPTFVVTMFHGKPASGIESKYLLSGLLRCSECGGNMVVNKTQGKRGRPVVRYVCANHKQRPGSCPNKRGLSVATAHAAVLEQLRHEMTWAGIADRLSAMIEAPARHEAERADLTARIARLDSELGRLTEAIAAGSAPATIVKAIEQREAERRDLAARLEHLQGLSLDLPDFTTEEGRAAWAAEIQPLLADLQATLEGDPAKARQRVKEVLPEPIIAIPRTERGWAHVLGP